MKTTKAQLAHRAAVHHEAIRILKGRRQHQNRLRTRAPHGSPIHTRQIGCWVTEEMFEKFHARGGSQWLRRIMGRAK